MEGHQRTILVTLEIGPFPFEIKFHIMDIASAYNYLLRRPWIHLARAVPLSLHQKVKFIVDEKLISLSWEENIVAMTSTEALYIEADTEVEECFLMSFEIINATFISERSVIPKPRLSKSTRVGLKLIVGKEALAKKGLGRHLQGISQAINVSDKKGKYGLGFEPE